METEWTTYSLPTQLLLPFPNGTYAFSSRRTSVGFLHRSGSNFVELGK
jgi:hypothetical protein